MNEDVSDFLFEHKLNEDLFDTEDEQLIEQKNKAKESQKKLITYIEKIPHVNTKNNLLEIQENREINYKNCFDLEHKAFYKNGIKDGISIIVSAITHK